MRFFKAKLMCEVSEEVDGHRLTETILTFSNMFPYLKNSSEDGMAPGITFDLGMIETQSGFHSKAKILVDNIWGMGSPCLSRNFCKTLE